MKLKRDFAFFYLNGEAQRVRGADVFLNLSDYLRINRSLTGTKVVCAEGDCGACSVLRAFPKPGTQQKPVFEAINSCILKVGQLDGSSIVTVEALKELMPNEELHPIQQSMIECHGSQCGFCTPGFVVTLAGAMDKKILDTEQAIKNELTGNLCRCTGYTPIIESALNADTRHLLKINSVFMTTQMEKDLRYFQKQSWSVEDKYRFFESPSNLDDLCEFRNQSPKSVLLGAGTDIGVAVNKGRFDAKHFLSLHLIADLYKIKQTSKTLQIGARVTLSEFRKCLEKNKKLEEYLHIFASPQIKNLGTVVGNVANASPIGDTPPLLLALDAEVEIFSPKKRRIRKVLLSNFYKSYKNIDLTIGEIIWSLNLKLPEPEDQLMFNKVSQRRDLDISCVNTGFFLRFIKSSHSGKPKELRLALGGVGPTPLRLRQTEDYLMQEGLNEISLKVALDLAQQEIAPISDLRGSENYRRLVTHGLLKKFLQSSLKELLK